jgi:predicted dehydrogenase
MKWMIAGLGSIGRRHLHNLLALGERDILLYRTRRSTLPDADLDGLPVETNLQAALAHQPDAVVVANPTALHLDVAIPAAEAGCHLLLEKPVSHDLARVEELRWVLQRRGKTALVGFQFRFHPGLQKTAALLHEGAIGKPLSVHAHWGEYLASWHPWEDYRCSYSARADLGGGVVLTLSHPLDYLLWLFGGLKSLWAFTGRLGDLELEVEDTAEVGLQFASGMLGSVHLDYNQRPPAHWLEVVGSQGSLRWDNASGAVSWVTAGYEQPEVFAPSPGFERNQLFLSEMRHFVQVVRGEAAPVCSLDDGIQSLRIALAVHQSMREEQKVYL